MRTTILAFVLAGIFASCDSKSGSTDCDRHNPATTNSDRRGDNESASSDKKDDGLFGDRKDTKADDGNGELLRDHALKILEYMHLQARRD